MINLNSAFEEELYFNFLRDPDSVSPEWQDYFRKVHGKSIFVNDNRINTDYSPTINTKNYSKSNTTTNFVGSDSKQPLSELENQHVNVLMETIDIPFASATRTIPVKALDENKRIINRYLNKLNKVNVSFTHILAWSVVKALEKFPNLNDSYHQENGQSYRIKKPSINVGLAVDIDSKEGYRLMLIPSIKNANKLSFDLFVAEYDRLIERARTNTLEYNDLLDTTITLTNPGMFGTTFSSPRLLNNQGIIVSAGTIDYPIEYSAVKVNQLSNLAISKVVNITSTYDHRIIHGVENAEFLAYMYRLLLGENRFYEQIFYSLHIPFKPIKWTRDVAPLNETNMKHSFTEAEKTAHVMLMINAYRVRGHLLASINPLGFETYYYPELDPEYYGFTIWDLDRIFHADDTWENNNLFLREIIETVRETYCGSVGFEFMHIQDPQKKDWIKKKLEFNRNTPSFTNEEKIRILEKLIEAEMFEHYLHTKFIGSKRFSLEGGESVIVMMDRIFHEAADKFMDTIVIGMAHRGRLNVLVNNIGKSYLTIFNEFEGVYDEKSYQGSGDVKYHLGQKGVYTSPSGNEINLILAPNPSHLELVDPVVVGMARALDNHINDKSFTQVLPILLHGDSAFAGQGIVAETLNMSQLDGYKVGGTIHIIINNQIGFTTNFDSARSTIYATDIAKMIQTPILHVNGNDVEQVANAAIFALEYRNTFKSDVIIDLLCYRKYGHNEADEPSYTQPLLYKKIKSMQTAAQIYQKKLMDLNVLTIDQLNDFESELKEKLDNAYLRRKEPSDKSSIRIQDKNGRLFINYNTKITKEIIYEITDALTSTPNDFIINPKVAPLLKKRREMVYSENTHIDWAMAELLALGSLLIENYSVRFTGQDSQRGTFSHRHAVLTDYEREYDFIPINHIRKGQSILRIYDSPLSEMAVLGYEYGYSVVALNTLTFWEAQFGDFANNAQTVVDQYISCSEFKWGIFSNLVMLLPHGYDGQGPEHSSARMERYLQACAQDNMIVANLTEPAQYFHIIRRQIYQPYKMPLIMATPKGMLRHPLAVSSIEDLTEGHFQHLIDDKNFINDTQKVRKILLCSGKIYFEIIGEIQKHNIDDIAVVRIEQYYPFNSELFENIIRRYTKNVSINWVQEEPKNMGAWLFIRDYLTEVLDKFKYNLNYIGRPAAAATATGISTVHNREQSQILENCIS